MRRDMVNIAFVYHTVSKVHKHVLEHHTLRLYHPYESNCGESFTFTLYTPLLSIFKFKYCEHFRWQIKAIYSELKISPLEILWR